MTIIKGSCSINKDHNMSQTTDDNILLNFKSVSANELPFRSDLLPQGAGRRPEAVCPLPLKYGLKTIKN